MARFLPQQRLVMLDADEHDAVLATLRAMHGLLVWTLCLGSDSFGGAWDSIYTQGLNNGYSEGAHGKRCWDEVAERLRKLVLLADGRLVPR
jgi:hypothetical protein